MSLVTNFSGFNKLRTPSNQSGQAHCVMLFGQFFALTVPVSDQVYDQVQANSVLVGDLVVDWHIMLDLIVPREE